MKKRTATVERKTRETDIKVSLTIDGKGVSHVETGIPFLNHMLELFSKHSLMDLTIDAKGDLEVDYHHTVEDLGLVLGDAIDQALGDRKGIVLWMMRSAGLWWIWEEGLISSTRLPTGLVKSGIST